MRRLGPRGRRLKWAGTIALVLIGLVWAVSLRLGVGHTTKTGSFVDRRGGNSRVVPLGSEMSLARGIIFYANCKPVSDESGWRGLRFGGWPLWAPLLWQKEESVWFVILPLWIPFLMLAVPVGHLWRRDRRVPSCCCQACGYNLTGNTSGVCPECGERTPVETGSAQFARSCTSRKRLAW